MLSGIAFTDLGNIWGVARAQERIQAVWDVGGGVLIEMPITIKGERNRRAACPG